MIKNVLVIMGDHFRHDAFSFIGNPYAHTPNLDRLARDSVHFTQCICQSPVCSPARHSLATGRYVHAHGVLNNSHTPYRGMRTVAHALEPHGFRRLHAGHMHWFGDVDNGYEEMLSPGRSWMDALTEKKRKIFLAERTDFMRRTTAGPSPRTVEEHWGWDVAHKMIAKLEGAVAADEPFLSWTSFTEPHPPFRPPAELYRLVPVDSITLPKWPPEDAPLPHPRISTMQQEWAHLTDFEFRQMLAGYYGMVALADYYAGLMLDTVERLGVRDETAIIWHSDHGDQAGEHRMMLKFNMREGSVRVPLLISAPGIAAGQCDALVEQVDILPTICELLGVEVPASVQGRSLVPLLQGEQPASWRKACFSQIDSMEMIRTNDWKLNVYDDEPGELYHLADDPREFNNLIKESGHREKAEELYSDLLGWRSDDQPEFAEPGVLRG